MFSTSRNIIHVQILVLFMGYIFPFLWQLFYSNSNATQWRCLWICLFTSIGFFLLEVNQMHQLGVSYFSSFWNIIDFCMFITFCMYFIKAHLLSIRNGNTVNYTIPGLATDNNATEL